MKIRFEVSRGRSFYWPEFVRRAKKHGRHRQRVVAGVELHVVEFKTVDAALEVWQVTRSWKAVSYTVNGVVVPPIKFHHQMRAHLFRDVRVKDMLQEIIVRKAKERGRREAGENWRMGLGPDPELGF